MCDEAYLTGERNCKGLASVRSATCAKFKMVISFPTSSTVQGSKQWKCNLAAAWGQMATGGGYATLKESMPVNGVPV